MGQPSSELGGDVEHLSTVPYKVEDRWRLVGWIEGRKEGELALGGPGTWAQRCARVSFFLPLLFQISFFFSFVLLFFFVSPILQKGREGKKGFEEKDFARLPDYFF
jgi:hypothetical protein